MKRSFASILQSKLQYMSYHRDTARIIRRVIEHDSNCIDIGCHKGKFLDVILDSAPGGMHYAFEPLPSFFERLTQKFGGHHNVTLSQVALSGSEGTAEFIHVINSPGYSGLKERNYDGKAVEIERITVATNTLDNMMPRNRDIALIKMVVEGAELQVLRGGLQTIKRNKPVIIYESGLGAADQFGTSPNDIYCLLSQECGLKITTPRGFLHNSKPFTADEYAEQFYERLNYYFVAFP